MADAELQRVTPWTGELDPGPYGVPGMANPVVVAGLTDLSSVSVIARKGTRLPAIMGLDVPVTGRWVANDRIRIASDGPDQWRVVGDGFGEGGMRRKRPRQVFGARRNLERKHCFRDQLASHWTDDVHTKDLVVVFGGDDLDHAGR